MKLNTQRILSLVLLGIGVLLGTLVFGLATWTDLEAALFSSGITADESLSSMRCPILITKSETGKISAVVANPFDRVLNAAVRAQVSEGLVTFKREDTVQINLQPGERKEVSWEVTPEDAVWDRVIFARIYQFANYPERSKGGNCGILVLDLGSLKGNHIVIGLVILSMIGMGSGLYTWQRIHYPLKGRPRDAMRGMATLSLIVIAGLLSVFFAMWFFGVLMLMLALILVGSVISNLMMS